MKNPNRFTFKRLRSQIPMYDTTLIKYGGREVGTIRRCGRYYEAFIGPRGGAKVLSGCGSEDQARVVLNARFAELVEKYQLQENHE